MRKDWAEFRRSSQNDSSTLGKLKLDNSFCSRRNVPALDQSGKMERVIRDLSGTSQFKVLSNPRITIA